MKRLTLIFLGQTGAGPVYSLEMAKAILATQSCQMQIVISKRVCNLSDWEKEFQNANVRLDVVETYGHNKLDFAISMFKFWRIEKIIGIINDFSPHCLYAPFLLTWDFLIYPRLNKNIKIVATLHDPHPHDAVNNPFIKWIKKKNKDAYRYVNDVIILNNLDVEYVKNNYCKNVHVIPHASFSYYSHIERMKEKPSDIKKTIGFIGRIEPYKGLDLLIDAFERIDNTFNLIIAGSGKIEERLLERINNNSRIELINRYIEDNEFSNLLDRVDFVVLPYKRASQSGVIPLAFAQKKTVVATNVGALSEQVPEGTGILVKPDSHEIMHAIVTLYENPNLIKDYGNAAYKYACTELTWEKSATSLLSII